jgi:hypothetical protein
MNGERLVVFLPWRSFEEGFYKELDVLQEARSFIVTPWEDQVPKQQVIQRRRGRPGLTGSDEVFCFTAMGYQPRPNSRVSTITTMLYQNKRLPS